MQAAARGGHEQCHAEERAGSGGSQACRDGVLSQRVEGGVLVRFLLPQCSLLLEACPMGRSRLLLPDAFTQSTGAAAHLRRSAHRHR